MSGDVPDCSNLSWGNRSREGTITGEKVSQLYRFVVGYQDPTDLYHLGARYLDTNLGRFTQPDPSGLETDPYLYASGDPTNIIDPSGLFSFGNFMGDSGARWWRRIRHPHRQHGPCVRHHRGVPRSVGGSLV
ncbi:RHS repeat-associated core domain-containing protein [Streptomyces sp. NPDC020766]|uniref:RHS repeat-associated core domain-containing protein n=1 Tax=Streptomyces sp. NPDC020766 TaxID=3155011 RepID=UPI0033DB89CB